jgi:ATP-dependent Clp protease ATP-binding subunit ClpC
MFERFTEEARRSLFFARYAVTDHGGSAIEPEHLLLGATHKRHAVLPLSFTPAILSTMEDRLIAAVSRGEKKLPTTVEIPFSDAAKDVLKRAAVEADDLNSKEIRTAHLILGILSATQGVAFDVLHDAGVRLPELRALLAQPSA